MSIHCESEEISSRAPLAPPLNSDDDSGVCGTDITMGFLERTLQEIFETEAKFGPNAKTEDIGFMNGFLSYIVRLLPDWQQETGGDNGIAGNRLPASLVVKIPSWKPTERLRQQNKQPEQQKSVDEMIDQEKRMDAFRQIILMGHASEASFYEMAMTKRLCEQFNIPHCFYQRQFGCNGESGLLIMEDLSAKAETKKIYEGLSVNALKELFTNLAAVHAYSLKNDAWRQNPNLKFSFGKFNKLREGHYAKMLGLTLNVLKTTYPNTFDPLIDRLADIFNAGFDAHEMDVLAEKLGLPSVLTHGDLWMNNIMWERRQLDDGKTTTTDKLVAIVDWQLIHPGCIGEDFARLMCSSVDPEVRREHLTALIEHYHRELREKLGEEPPFTAAQIIAAYKRLFLYGVVTVLPLYGGYLAKETGMLGTEDVDGRQQIMLKRARCIIEDLYSYEDELLVNQFNQ